MSGRWNSMRIRWHSVRGRLAKCDCWDFTIWDRLIGVDIESNFRLARLAPFFPRNRQRQSSSLALAARCLVHIFYLYNYS